MSGTPADAIEIRDLSKVYRVPHSGHRNLLGSLSLLKYALMSQRDRIPPGFYPFHALKPVSLSVKKGEAVGIIGRNGSGKSTLLQLVAGTLAPTTGSVAIRGSVSALLELGSGFALEYTGLENIFLNGAILGLKRTYLEEKLDEILEFAEIGDFIHQPIKTYSSGMRVRLAFSVLATVRPEILIIDEALSVGDTFFQSKCSRWLEEYVAGGGSLLCVSHDMFLLQRLCQRGIVLEKGEVLLDGPIAEAATLYFKLQQKEQPLKKKAANGAQRSGNESSGESSQLSELDFRTKERTGDGQLEIVSIRTDRDLVKECEVGDWLQFEVEVLAHADVSQPELGIGFRDRTGQLIAGYHTHFTEGRPESMKAGRRYRLKVDVHLQIKPRPYLLMVGVGRILEGSDEWEDYDTLWDCAQVIVQGQRQFWGLAPVPVKGFTQTEVEAG
jgi:ABC-type polysaccharide/polyol phosphate transport system ATPase subunit